MKQTQNRYESIQLGFKDGESVRKYIDRLIKAVSYAERALCVEYERDELFGVIIVGSNAYDNDVVFSATIKDNVVRIEIKGSVYDAVRFDKLEVGVRVA